MKTCPKCNYEYPDTQFFCYTCGAKLKEVGGHSVETEHQNTANSQPEERVAPSLEFISQPINMEEPSRETDVPTEEPMPPANEQMSNQSNSAVQTRVPELNPTESADRLADTTVSADEPIYQPNNSSSSESKLIVSTEEHTSQEEEPTSSQTEVITSTEKTSPPEESFTQSTKKPIGLIITVVALSLAVAFFAFQTFSAFSDVEYYQSRMESYRRQLRECEGKYDDAEEKLDFYEKYARVIQTDGNGNYVDEYYHIYGCADCNTDHFLIYNINAAKGKIAACPICCPNDSN